MNALNPLGDLNRLPAETRTMIYGYVLLGTKFIAHGQRFLETFVEDMGLRDPVPSPPSSQADVSILCTSSTISKEAKEVLYKEGVFTVYLNFLAATPVTLLQAKANPMMNVEFVINMRDFHQYCEETGDEMIDQETVEDMIGDVVGRFTSVEVLRRTCWIRFWSCTGDNLHQLLENTPIVQPYLLRLVGFRAMMVQVESYFLRKDFIKADTNLDVQKVQDYLGNRHDEPADECFVENQEFYPVVKTIFDVSFDPSEMALGPYDSRLVFSARLKYYPRLHIARKIRSEAAKLSKDAEEMENGKGLENSDERSQMARDLMQNLTI